VIGSSRVRISIPLVSLMVMTACGPASPAVSPTALPEKPAAAAATAVPPTAKASEPTAPVATQPTAAPTEDPALASLWRGKTITMIVGDAAGGGTDTTGRIVSRHLSRYLPGQPQIIVQNMPGAGHRVATNFVYQAKPTGSRSGWWTVAFPHISSAVKALIRE